MQPQPPGNRDTVGHVEAMCVQSDWKGTICRETWFGRFSPWRRITSFVLISSWALTLTWIFQLYLEPTLFDGIQIPILKILSEQEMIDIKESHAECVVSLCEEVGRVVPVHCIVNDDGKSARVEYEADQQPPPPFIPIPQACHDATEKTFGYRFLDKDDSISTPAVALMSLLPSEHDNTTASTANTTSLFTLLPECAVVINTAHVLSKEDIEAIRQQLGDIDTSIFEGDGSSSFQGADMSLAMSLVDLFGHHAVPGHQETYVLKKVFCADELPEEIQANVLPILVQAYHFFLEYRFEIVATGIYCFHIWRNVWSVLWLMARLLLPAFVLQRCLKWPSEIQYWDIWRSLLVLCVISNQRSLCVLLSILLAAGACWYRNTNAAMEWVFLGMFAWGASDLFPILDDLVGEALARLDGLHLARWAIHLVVVGDGWWKLVSMYVVFRAYQSLQSTMRPARTGGDNGLHETHLSIRPDHEKVD